TTTVASGSFSVAVSQRTSSGGGHDRDHYSEGAGNHVRRESYDANGNRVSDQQLTSYRYQSSTLGLLLIGIGIAVVAVIAIAVLVTLRRRRARGPPQAPPRVAPPPPGGRGRGRHSETRSSRASARPSLHTARPAARLS